MTPDVPDAESQLDRAVALFRDRFGRDPTLAAAAPGRVNLIGDHTDYNDGFVLPMAIDRAAVVVADRAPDGRPSTFCSADLDECVEIDLADSPPPRHGAWTGYLVGVAEQFRSAGHRPVDLDLLVSSGVPIGAGLASSAALEVAMATLLETMHGVALDAIDKARLCRLAEHRFAGAPCGIMDQLVATSASAGSAILIDCRTLERRPIPMPSADDVAVLVADTGVRHDHAAGAYAERRARCLAAATALGAASLRDVGRGALDEASLPTIEARCARHVIEENDRTCAAADALERGDVAALGRLMYESHASLRDLFEVSCPEQNTLVEAAAATGPAGDPVFGARMTGGGFGGCVVVLCRTDAADEIGAVLGERFVAAHGRRATLSRVRPAGCATAIAVPARRTSHRS